MCHRSQCLLARLEMGLVWWGGRGSDAEVKGE